ncbi:hypothetical protein QQ045_014643 [Rhodiola kirilowii]
MISAISWIPKGACKPVPESAEPPSKEDIEEALKNASLSIEGSEDELEAESSGDDMEAEASRTADVANALAAAAAMGSSSKPKFADIEDGMRELDMDHYDDEDEGIELFSSGLGDLYYPSNEMDPYLKDKDGYDSEEAEDIAIKPMDLVIVCARNEEDVNQLEIWLYEDSGDNNANMYVHHDIILSAFPLCTAWLDCPLKGGDKGNFIAVGSIDPSIEIWDLDVLDEVEPHVVLGGVKKKGKKKSVKYHKDSHTDSVLDLAWNKEYRNILASASADKLVKVWDVATGKCKITMDHHTDKVQSVAWNHYQPQVLLSGSFDHSVVMRDGRTPSHPGIRWSVPVDVENLAWNPHAEHSFVVSLEDGSVKGFDIRTASSDAAVEAKPSFTLHAHDKAVCAVAYSPSVPNLLATGSTDKMVKIWDLSSDQPSFIASNNPKAGSVFSMSFSEDNPFLLAIGGAKGKLQLWDISTDAGVSRLFGKHINAKKA